MRYLFLLILNIPIIVIALLNTLTKYKTRKITPRRFRIQTSFWLVLLILLILSFPLYNYLIGNRFLESDDLSLLDILQVTAIVYLIYTVNSLRQKQEQTERRLRDLHQELSIIMSKK